MLQKIIDRFLPGQETLLHLTLPLAVFSIAVAALTGFMRVKKNIPVPYTRKTFHFLVFSAAGLLQYFYGLKAVSLLGSIVVIIVLLAVIAGPRLWFFRSLARETDAPHEKKFIIVPLFATAIGGIISNILFPQTAFIGYFVGGLGDAVGEPVGKKWGKHQYTVPTLFGVKATRSLEGSAAVFAVSFMVAVFCLFHVSSFSVWNCILVGFICGLTAAVVEAISSHGLDNLTIQVFAAAVIYFSLFLKL
ncbi:MAG: dolichol kinase [Chitinophagaceae bacterium]|nr:dolichol kinase [Chitinophagaceae bacterium]